jgi:hypothetical protein
MSFVCFVLLQQDYIHRLAPAFPAAPAPVARAAPAGRGVGRRRNKKHGEVYSCKVHPIFNTCFKDGRKYWELSKRVNNRVYDLVIGGPTGQEENMCRVDWLAKLKKGKDGEFGCIKKVKRDDVVRVLTEERLLDNWTVSEKEALEGYINTKNKYGKLHDEYSLVYFEEVHNVTSQHINLNKLSSRYKNLKPPNAQTCSRLARGTYHDDSISNSGCDWHDLWQEYASVNSSK